MKRAILFLFLYLILFSPAGCKRQPSQKYLTFYDAVNNIASQKTMPVPPQPQPPKELKILSARYGAKDTWLDVTAQLQEKVQDNRLLVYSFSTLAGDPCFGIPKILEVELILDGVKQKMKVREGVVLQIPPVFNPNDPLNVIQTPQELSALAQACPAEVGFYGINFTTGKTIDYHGGQPACMASIVKLFVLLEIMRQADAGELRLSESIDIEYAAEKKTCSIPEAIDLMIGISDNEATGALARRVGYARVNALARELCRTGIGREILPEPGVLEGVLDKRVYGMRVAAADTLLPQHGTARGIVQFFSLLHEKKLVNESVSKNVLAALERNPKLFAPRATPADHESVGKGGSIVWKRPFRPQYNMSGWGLYIYNPDEDEAVAFCFWTEWFPEDMKQLDQLTWTSGLSECIVNLLLKKEDI